MAERMLFTETRSSSGNFRNLAIAIVLFLAIIVFVLAYSRILGN